jgi:hypothetical protein
MFIPYGRLIRRSTWQRRKQLKKLQKKQLKKLLRKKLLRRNSFISSKKVKTLGNPRVFFALHSTQAKSLSIYRPVSN